MSKNKLPILISFLVNNAKDNASSVVPCVLYFPRHVLNAYLQICILQVVKFSLQYVWRHYESPALLFSGLYDGGGGGGDAGRRVVSKQQQEFLRCRFEEIVVFVVCTAKWGRYFPCALALRGAKQTSPGGIRPRRGFWDFSCGTVRAGRSKFCEWSIPFLCCVPGKIQLFRGVQGTFAGSRKRKKNIGLCFNYVCVKC